MNHNRKTGIKGEDIAERYLKTKGMKILDRNWRFMHKEIDIVARENDCLIVVEVKTRSSSTNHNPLENVTLKKQSFLVVAAEEYLIRKKLDMDVRFDIILVVMEKNHTRVEHIKDAFHPVAH